MLLGVDIKKKEETLESAAPTMRSGSSQIDDDPGNTFFFFLCPFSVFVIRNLGFMVEPLNHSLIRFS